MSIDALAKAILDRAPDAQSVAPAPERKGGQEFLYGTVTVVSPFTVLLDSEQTAAVCRAVSGIPVAVGSRVMVHVSEGERVAVGVVGAPGSAATSPVGVVAYTSPTTSGWSTDSPTHTDITNASLTFNVVQGALYEVTFRSAVTATVSATQLLVALNMAGSVVHDHNIAISATNNPIGLVFRALVSGTATGSQTWKMQGRREAGTGVASVVPTAANPMQLWVTRVSS